MRMTHRIEKINLKHYLTVAFDVGKENLNYYYEVPGKVKSVERTVVDCYEGEIENKCRAIDKMICKMEIFAEEKDYGGLHIVCEPTGAYDRKLMRCARKRGHTTAYVSGESVSKMKVVENNDTGKTDIKDPRVIYMLSKKMGKELTYRELKDEYLLLRECNRMYDVEDSAQTSVKCQIHNLLVRLFCDYSFKKDFLYIRSGKVLVEQFYASPYRIVKFGYERFCKVMKKHAPRIRKKTLDRLWDNAQSSILHQMDEEYVSVLEGRMLHLYEEYELRHTRRAQIKQQIIFLYRRLLKKGEPVPKPDNGFLTEFRIGRILGETGPLTDFPNKRTILKYGGLNLRERQSGYYIGKTRLSKKGRSTLRNAVGQAAFRLVKKNEFFGPYYHRKKEEGMIGTKALAAVERKLLQVFYVLGIRKENFYVERLHACESALRKAA
jgi:transposase